MGNEYFSQKLLNKIPNKNRKYKITNNNNIQIVFLPKKRGQLICKYNMI